MRKIAWSVAVCMMAVMVWVASPKVAESTMLTITESNAAGESVAFSFTGGTLTINRTGLQYLTLQVGSDSPVQLQNGYINLTGQVSGSTITEGTFTFGGALSGNSVQFSAAGLTGTFWQVPGIGGNSNFLIVPQWTGSISNYLATAHNFLGMGTGGMCLYVFQNGASDNLINPGSFVNFSASPNPVPIPSTFLLLAAGLGLVRLRRR